MGASAILARLETIVAEAIERERIELEPKTQLHDIPGLDSFGVIAMFMSIEAAFGLRFTIDEINTMKTIDDVLAGIQSRQRS